MLEKIVKMINIRKSLLFHKQFSGYRHHIFGIIKYQFKSYFKTYTTIRSKVKSFVRLKIQNNSDF